jgi:Leucine-rich repeat (LRR) protein
LQGVGLSTLSGIQQVFPNLVYLDVSDNGLYSLELIEHLKHLQDFVDLNLKSNPVCVHEDLKSELLTQMPNIERINGEQVRESGWKYKQAAMEMKKNMKEAGGEVVEEFENDVEIQQILRQLKELEGNDEGFKLGNQAKKMDQILKKDMMKTKEKNELQNFEKSFGYRLKKMTDDQEVPINAANVDELFKSDAEMFE